MGQFIWIEAWLPIDCLWGGGGGLIAFGIIELYINFPVFFILPVLICIYRLTKSLLPKDVFVFRESFVLLKFRSLMQNPTRQQGSLFLGGIMLTALLKAVSL